MATLTDPFPLFLVEQSLEVDALHNYRLFAQQVFLAKDIFLGVLLVTGFLDNFGGCELLLHKHRCVRVVQHLFREARFSLHSVHGSVLFVNYLDQVLTSLVEALLGCTHQLSLAMLLERSQV